MKKIRDFIYDYNDIFVALLIIAVAAVVIVWRVNSIMDYPNYVAEKGGNNPVQTADANLDNVDLTPTTVDENLNENPENTSPEDSEEPSGEGAETPAETAVIAVPEGQTVTIDSETGAAILERLDRLIALLSAAAETLPPQADEDPAEEVSEAVEELLEAAVAPDEGLAEIIESIQDPISAILEPEEETPAESPQAADALRAAIRTIRPALAKMPKRERARVCAQIADRMRSGRDTADSRGVISALARSRRGSEDPGELGRRIMAARNINQRK